MMVVKGCCWISTVSIAWTQRFRWNFFFSNVLDFKDTSPIYPFSWHPQCSQHSPSVMMVVNYYSNSIDKQTRSQSWVTFPWWQIQNGNKTQTCLKIQGHFHSSSVYFPSYLLNQNLQPENSPLSLIFLQHFTFLCKRLSVSTPNQDSKLNDFIYRNCRNRSSRKLKILRRHVHLFFRMILGED